MVYQILGMRNATIYYNTAIEGNALRGDEITLNSHAYEKQFT
jgi:hypothetical protein